MKKSCRIFDANERVFGVQGIREAEGWHRPLSRRREILDEMTHRSGKLFDLAVPVDDNEDGEYNIRIMTSVVVVGLDLHDPRMLSTLRDAHASWLSENPQCDPDYADPKEHGAVPLRRGLVPYHFCPLERVSPGLFETALPAYRRLGAFCRDLETPIHQFSFALALAAARHSIQAAEWLLPASTDKRVAYCLNASPGHHAGRDFYGGYCLMANAAICAMRFVDRIGSRGSAVILNLDYHCSQGTADVIRRSSRRDLTDRIFCVSIHADPLMDYPSFVGFEDDDTDTTKNITFSAGTDFAGYRPLLERALTAISAQVERWKLEKDVQEILFVIELGTDTLEGDPNPSVNAGAALKVQDFGQMGALISKFFDAHGIYRAAVVQEGGYKETAVAVAVVNFLEGLTLGD